MAVSKVGPLEIGEAVVFTHGPGTVEALHPGGGNTVKAEFGKSFTFMSDGLFNILARVHEEGESSEHCSWMPPLLKVRSDKLSQDIIETIHAAARRRCPTSPA